MEGAMRGRWSLGVVVAIVVAICVATSGNSHSAPAQRPSQRFEVNVALNADGPSIGVRYDALAISLEF